MLRSLCRGAAFARAAVSSLAVPQRAALVPTVTPVADFARTFSNSGVLCAPKRTTASKGKGTAKASKAAPKTAPKTAPKRGPSPATKAAPAKRQQRATPAPSRKALAKPKPKSASKQGRSSAAASESKAPRKRQPTPTTKGEPEPARPAMSAEDIELLHQLLGGRGGGMLNSAARDTDGADDEDDDEDADQEMETSDGRYVVTVTRFPVDADGNIDIEASTSGGESILDGDLLQRLVDVAGAVADARMDSQAVEGAASAVGSRTFAECIEERLAALDAEPPRAREHNAASPSPPPWHAIRGR